MPGSMIHLLLAHKINPKGSVLFYIGNLAPDSVTNWKEKDITHFRNLTDRSESLTSLAVQTSPSDDFNEGVMLHLYMDWRWDIEVRDEFIKKVDSDWFTKYREELSLAGGYAFHHTNWARDLWNQMDNFDAAKYGAIPGATTEELKDFISRNNKWHNDNNTHHSTAFTPDFICEFINRLADEYTQWKILQEINYYNSQPVIFDEFIDMPELSDDEIVLFCTAKKPAIPEKKWVPAYVFEIHRNSSLVGEINLRIGYTDTDG